MIVITGASGTIPRSAAAALKKSGAAFRVLARDPSKAPEGAEVVAGDLAKPETLRRAFEGADTLLLVSPASPEIVKLQRNALDAARESGIRKVVRISALGSSQSSPVGLGRWHGELDEAFAGSGLTYVSIQPHGFMQNTFGYAETVRREGVVYAPLGEGRVCYIDARDIGAVAAAVASSSTWDGKTLELTGPAAFSYAELASDLGSVLGKTVRYVDVPPEAARDAMLKNQFPAWLADDLITLCGLYAANMASKPTSTVNDVLGRPATSLRQFFADHRSVFAA